MLTTALKSLYPAFFLAYIFDGLIFLKGENTDLD